MEPEATEKDCAAARILDTLAGAGVRQVFGLPGVHNLAFWRHLRDDRPTIVGVRHEQTTVYAADGLARATGRLGVALTTTGPGAVNAAGAFGEAAASGSPVLLIATEVPQRLRREGVVRGLLHESRDQAAVFEPLAKKVFRARTPEEATSMVAEAAALALQWPRGPVYVDIPTDLLDSAAPPAEVSQAVRLTPNPAELRQAAEALDAAQRIVMWVGGGAAQSAAGPALTTLAEKLGAVVLSTYSGRGVVSDTHPASVGVPPHEPECARLLREADLLLTVGTDLDAINTKAWQLPFPSMVVSVNVDHGDMVREIQPDVALVGDAKVTAEQLVSLVSARKGYWTDTAALRSEARRGFRDDPRTSSALELVEAVERSWPEEGVLVADMAVAGYWVSGYAELARSGQMQVPLGWGTLGYGLPAAVGPGSAGIPTLVVCGDGGFMFGIGELATLAQHDMPVTVLVVDDGGYGMLRFDQQGAGHERRGVDLAGADLVSLADAFGIRSRKVGDISTDLHDALREAAASGRPTLLSLEARLTPPRTTSARWND
ncbi:MAG TPA: thiamine pyrophosphate-binding protein [Actinomycetales bacterium]|jgi:acetolactate synthase-1/2/3 large subunit|nr:thiamine pyrophosphate-binding protein [Actinomycetales bacterium]